MTRDETESKPVLKVVRRRRIGDAAGLAPALAQEPVKDPLGVVKIAKGQPITLGYWLVVSE